MDYVILEIVAKVVPPRKACTPGDEVEFECRGERAVLPRVAQPEQVVERIAACRGSADSGFSTEEILEMTRR
jgi:hypothetical protein